MRITIFREHKNLYLFLIVGVLILWKSLLYLDLPYPYIDGPWALSHCFSILNGKFFESSFAFSYWIPFQSPPMYGIITSILFSILHKISQTYSIFLFNIIMLIVVIILSDIYLKRKNSSSILKLFIFLSLITSSYSYLQRPEFINLVLLLLQLNLIDNSRPINNMKIFLISFLSAIISLVHPVGGFFSIFLITFIAIKKKINWKFYVKYYLLVACIVGLIYLPIVLLNISTWYKNYFLFYISSSGQAYHGSQIWDILSYFYISPCTFLPFFLILLSTIHNFKRVIYEISILFVFLLFISFFGAYYYYIYLYVFILWRAGNLNYEINLKTFILVIIIILSPYMTHYVPTYSQILNRKYSDNFRNILEHIYVEDYASNYDKVWCNFHISMPLIKYSNVRLLHQFYEERFKLEGNDIILIVDIRFIEIVKKKFMLKDSEICIKKIFPPVQQDFPININWKFKQRNVPICLYEITLNKSPSE